MYTVQKYSLLYNNAVRPVIFVDIGGIGDHHCLNFLFIIHQLNLAQLFAHMYDCF